jgi:A/G-specific adenine glycosylase
MKEPLFSERLLTWWDIHGRKDLPWQHPRTAYRVWVSEIMLQQTQVRTVILYFDRFVDQFPDVESLATAATDDVLSLWSGLGYYARARNLHKAAQICVSQHSSRLPDQPSDLAALPGIGESTANAIYSQAYNQPAVILDGNVKRVLARHGAVAGWPGKSNIHRILWSMAAELLPQDRGADYTQAVMDLGATVCTRSKPDCALCPVSSDCKARLQDRTDEFPASRPKLKIANRALQMLILTDANDRVLLERRPPTGIWGGLWSLPTDDDRKPLAQRLGVNNEDLQSLPKLQHQLTHIKMTITPLIGKAEPGINGVECSPDQDWFDHEEWPGLGLPKPVRQLLEQHMTISQEDKQ